MQTSSMIYAGIGVALTATTFAINRKLYRNGGVGGLEAFYYIVAAAGLGIGWYFNLQYMAKYGAQAGWAHWVGLLFVNPASASGGQDLIIANAIIFPVWSFVEARRAGMKAGWIYFPMSVVTSYAFALALFLAIRERQEKAGRLLF